MTFTSGIPTTGQSLGVTKQPIQDNFTNYNTVVSVDHVAPNATGQGEHKKISYNAAGTPPYVENPIVPGSPKSYEYSQLLASGVRSYLQYQPSGPETFPAADPTFVPISPKCYVVFATLPGPSTSGPIVTFYRKFNIASVAQTNSNSWTVTFNENMPDANYFVSSFVLGNSSIDYAFSSQFVGSFILNTTLLPSKIGFMVF